MKASSTNTSTVPGDGNPDGLTSLQCRFLREVSADPHCLRRVAERVGIDSTLLDDWLLQKAFEQRLRRVERAVRRRQAMSLSLASARATDVLARGVEEDATLKPEQRRTCVDLLKLARPSQRRRPARPRAPEIQLPDNVGMAERQRLIDQLDPRDGEVSQ